jgi:hypothetical protein
MPRQLRVEFAGAIYHLMSRGDRRENIFRDDVDRQDFFKTLAEACPRPAKRRGSRCMPIASWAITFIWWWKHPRRTWWRECAGS